MSNMDNPTVSVCPELLGLPASGKTALKTAVCEMMENYYGYILVDRTTVEFLHGLLVIAKRQPSFLWRSRKVFSYDSSGSVRSNLRLFEKYRTRWFSWAAATYLDTERAMVFAPDERMHSLLLRVSAEKRFLTTAMMRDLLGVIPAGNLFFVLRTDPAVLWDRLQRDTRKGGRVNSILRSSPPTSYPWKNVIHNMEIIVNHVKNNLPGRVMEVDTNGQALESCAAIICEEIHRHVVHKRLLSRFP